LYFFKLLSKYVSNINYSAVLSYLKLVYLLKTESVVFNAHAMQKSCSMLATSNRMGRIEPGQKETCANAHA